MMSTENLLGEAKDVEQPNPRSLKKSIKAELEKHALDNLGFGLSLSVLGGAILLLLASAIVATASGLFALAWGLYSVLFLNHELLEVAAINIVLIATLSIAWPLNYAHSTLYRHLFLATILSPLLVSLYIYFPQMQTGFLALVVLFYGVASKAVANYRNRLL